MKRLFTFVFIIVALALSSINTVFAENKTAIDLTKSSKITSSGSQNGGVLTDGNYSSKLNLKAGTKISVKNTTAFSSIYVIWDKPVSKWTLTINGMNYTYGENGFLHEYINLPYITNEVTITIPDDGAILCDIYSFSTGETPAWVQKWGNPYEKADMLLLPTHADDEFIFFGGTIPYYSGQLGLKVQVAYLTEHWREPYRPHEMLNGLWASGEKAYPVIGVFPDSLSETLDQAKKTIDFNQAVEYYVKLIREFKPSVIIGHDLKGEYGHGQHMLSSNALTEALEKSADKSFSPQTFERYGLWDVPKTYLHLYKNNAITMDWNKPLSNFNGKTAFEMAVYGYSFHISQQKWYKVRQVAGVYDCRQFGLYRTKVGEDVKKDDFMENITLTTDNSSSETDISKSDSSDDTSDISSGSDVLISNKKNNNFENIIIFVALISLIFISLIIIQIIRRRNINKK